MGDRFYQEQIKQGRKPEKEKYFLKANHIFNDLVEPDTPKPTVPPVEEIFSKEVKIDVYPCETGELENDERNRNRDIPITAHGVAPDGEVIERMVSPSNRKEIPVKNQEGETVGIAKIQDTVRVNIKIDDKNDIPIERPGQQYSLGCFPTNEELQKLKVNHIEDYQDINYAEYNTEKMKNFIDSEFVFSNPEGIPLERTANEILAEQLARKATERLKEETPKTEFRLYELSPLIETLILEGELYASEHDGELPIELCDAIEHLEMKREEKKINIGLLIKDTQMKQKMLADEIKILQARKKVYENKVTSLINYLQKNMEYKEKINDERIKTTWRITHSCVIFDVDLLPKDCYKLEKKPLIQDVIKPALKKGSNIDGVEMVVTESLSIK